jgi:hypothetical protein
MPHGSEPRPRRDITACLTKAGFPISLHTLNRLCARGEGPPPAGIWRGQSFTTSTERWNGHVPASVRPK